MFIDENIPSNYNKIYELTDNYIVLGTSSSLTSDVDYDVYVQYFYPSIFYVHLEDYRIKLSNAQDLTYRYTYGNLGGLISSEATFTQNSYQIDRSDFSSSGFDRADYPLIFICGFIACFVFAWILNQLTKLVHKGGIFNG